MLPARGFPLRHTYHPSGYTLYQVAPLSFHTSPPPPTSTFPTTAQRAVKQVKTSGYESVGTGSFGSPTLGEGAQDHRTGVALTKHYVLPIQPITLRAGDEELAAVCTGTAVCLMETKHTCHAS